MGRFIPGMFKRAVAVVRGAEIRAEAEPPAPEPEPEACPICEDLEHGRDDCPHNLSRKTAVELLGLWDGHWSAGARERPSLGGLRDPFRNPHS